MDLLKTPIGSGFAKLKSTVFSPAKLIAVVLGAFFLLGLLLTLFQIPKIKSVYSVEQFFPRHHPDIERTIQRRKDFDLPKSQSVLVQLKLSSNQSWIENKNISKLKKFRNQLLKLPQVIQVQSLLDWQVLSTQNQEMQTLPLLQQSKRQQQQYLSHPNLAVPQVLSVDQRSTILIVDLRPESLTQLTEIESLLLKKLNSLSAQEIQITIGGLPLMQAQLAKKVQTEVGQSFALSLLAISLCLLLVYQGWATSIYFLIGFLVMNVFVLGALAWLRIPLNLLSATLPIIVSLTFTSLAIHSLHEWAKILVDSPPKNFTARIQASFLNLKNLAIGNFLGALTTAIGFACLIWTPIPLIQSFGKVVSVSVILVYFLSQIYLFLGQLILQPRLRNWVNSPAVWLWKVSRRSLLVLPLSLGLLTVFLIHARSIKLEASLLDDLSMQSHSLQRDHGGLLEGYIVISLPQGKSWKNQNGLNLLDRALTEIRKLTLVGSAHSITDLLGLNWHKVGNLSEVFFLYSMSEKNPLPHFLRDHDRQLRVGLNFYDGPPQDLKLQKTQILSILSKYFPQAQLETSGVAFYGPEINRTVSKDLVLGFWQSIAAIGILLIFVLRSVRWALVACFANLFPPIVLMGILSATQTPVKPSLALIFSIAMGLAFNNTVYLLSRLRKISGPANLALRKTVLLEGHPCSTESLVTFMGFSVFLISSFSVNRDFGLYMVIAIVASAFSDLVFLPALLREFPKLANRDFFNFQWRRLVPKTVSLSSWIFILLFLCVGIQAQGQTPPWTEEKILDQLKRQKDFRSESAQVELKTREKNGDVTERNFKFDFLRTPGKLFSKAKVSRPLDARGTAILVQRQAGQNQAWIYLPQTKKVRRWTSGGSAQGGLFGSEISMDDVELSVQDLKNSKFKQIKNRWWLVCSKKSKDTQKTWMARIRSEDQVIDEIQHFKNGKLAKTVQFLDFKKMNTRILRPQKMVATNIISGRTSTMIFTSHQINVPFSDAYFQPGQLGD